MPKNFQKSLQDYLSKIKKQFKQTPHLQFSPSSFSSATSKIISGCKHPKSLSFSKDRKGNKDDDHDQNDTTAATLEDIDRFLIENFKSLYGHNHNSQENHGFEQEKKKGKTREYHQDPDSDGTLRGVVFDSPRFFTPPSNLSGSHRFFVSPTFSGSLLEEAQNSGVGPFEDTGSTSTSTVAIGAHQCKPSGIPGGFEDCIVVLAVSPSPYEDFKKSMLEMIEARVIHDQNVDWDFMEDLLFCYLRLNEKKQHRYILSVFADLVVTLRQDSSDKRPEGLRILGDKKYY